jgi:4-hydroxy-2-oxoglutarate aldolase
MELGGVLAPVPTPFDEADRVDTRRLAAALARWLEHPLAGFVVLGSTGEAPLLDDEESVRVLAAAREAIPPTRWFIAGTGRESTRATIRASRRAAAAGADAVLVRTPGAFKEQLTSDALVGHYTAVADASPVPVLLYNFPRLTGVTLQEEAVARLAPHPNIAGIKDSSGEILLFTDFVSYASDTFSVFSGSGSTFFTAVCLGAAGGILALACVVPDACVRLFELARSGRHEEGRALQQELLELARLVGSVYGVPGVKAALRLVGLDLGRPRRPLPPASAEAVDRLRVALAAFQEAHA